MSRNHKLLAAATSAFQSKHNIQRGARRACPRTVYNSWGATTGPPFPLFQADIFPGVPHPHAHQAWVKLFKATSLSCPAGRRLMGRLMRRRRVLAGLKRSSSKRLDGVESRGLSQPSGISTMG